jgi:hypothetical protein
MLFITHGEYKMKPTKETGALAAKGFKQKKGARNCRIFKLS